MVPSGGVDRLGHLALGVLEVHDPGPGGRDGGLGDHKVVAVPVVEADGQLTGQLEVLTLVVADRHPLGVVEEDVGALEDRVGEQAGPDRVPPALLSLNWVIRRSSPMVAVHSSSQVIRACSGTWLWTNRQQRSGSRPAASRSRAVVEGPAAQLGRVDLQGQGVEVDDAVEGVVVVLVGHPVANGAQVVPQMEVAAGLDAGEDSGHGGSS